MKDTRKVILWQVGGTEKAYLFSTFPKGDANAKQIWIPKSLICHISRDPVRPNEWQRCTVEVEEWFLDKNEL